MNAEEKVDWYGIRTIYHFGQSDAGRNLFEERICVFSGNSIDEAFAKADQETDAYIADSNMTSHPCREAYCQDGDELIDGYEVFSQLFEFDGDLDQFYAERYVKFKCGPNRTYT